MSQYVAGVLERLGLGPDCLLKSNPRLVYARITGYGQTGPLSKVAGHDINYSAMSGKMKYSYSMHYVNMHYNATKTIFVCHILKLIFIALKSQCNIQTLQS